jgi:hypothetical protein
MPLRYPRRITVISYLISITLNLLLFLLISLVSRQYGLRSETVMQVDIIRLSRRMHLKRQTVQRELELKLPSLRRPSEPAEPQSLTRPKSIPLVTHADFTLPISSSYPTLPPPTEDLSVRQEAPDLRYLSDRTPAKIRIGRSRPGYPGSGTTGRRIGWPGKSGGNTEGRAQAEVKGSGRNVTGYYDIVTVRYEDTADIIRAQMLSNLVAAMNRWTNVRTRLLPESLPLDDPAIRRIPILYIAARNAFAFSEKERVNLREYLRGGGTMLFSDISPNWGIRGAVANSIRFELWKILGDISSLRPVERNDPICSSFFPFKKGPPLVDERRGRFYVLRLNGRIAVLYDAAGIGIKWMKAKSDERWLRWGVNLIVYTLTSKPSEAER